MTSDDNISMRPPYPFTAIVGQEQMKLALVLNAINPRIGGVLIRGERGTAKSTAVRALAALLPERRVVVGCRFACDPDQPRALCVECRDRVAKGEDLPAAATRMRVVELPVGASEDRVVGSIDIEAAIREGNRRFDPGLLAEANRNLLYVDEVNLLDDHLVDVLLDAAAMGINTVEREGMSFTHPARFILVGTMNPEEGELRPQLLDRFGLSVDVSGSSDVDDRVRIMEQDAERTRDPEAFAALAAHGEARAGADIAAAGRRLPHVAVNKVMLKLASSLAVAAGVSGHRADIVLTRTARALAALRGLDTVGLTEIQDAAELALNHRRREIGGQPKAQQDEMRQQAEEKLRELEAEDQKQQSEGRPEAASESEPGSGAEQEQVETSAGTAPLEPSDPTPVEGNEEFTGDLFPVAKIEIP
ncbi:MAG TPA: ATP-binding protein, partial [Candidatus Dormibacteraeota bacterium]|nr:ATP-binding protein [Candidatus Dormibacteraeota bacterium]